MRRSYLFAIRPPLDSPGEIPRAWWFPRALGPLAVLEVSKDGLRIIRPSRQGIAANFLAGLAVGLALLFGVYVPTAFIIITRLGVTTTSALVGYSVAAMLCGVILIPVYPQVRKLFAWHPQSHSVPVQVMQATLGTFHHELKIVGEGQEVRVRTNARRATITAALLLTHQMPSRLESLR